MAEKLCQKLGGGNGIKGILNSTSENIVQGAGNGSDDYTCVSPINGIASIVIGCSDGGSMNDNYVTVNGQRILTAQWGLRNYYTGYGNAVVPIKENDVIRVHLSRTRTNGFATAGYYYSVAFIK